MSTNKSLSLALALKRQKAEAAGGKKPSQEIISADSIVQAIRAKRKPPEPDAELLDDDFDADLLLYDDLMLEEETEAGDEEKPVNPIRKRIASILG